VSLNLYCSDFTGKLLENFRVVAEHAAGKTLLRRVEIIYPDMSARALAALLSKSGLQAESLYRVSRILKW
jgi:hypothetical protein